MLPGNRSALIGRCFATALAIGCCGVVQAQQGYETPALGAVDFAPAELLKGPNHSVDEKITLDGFMPRFTIRSPYGLWEARGREMLGIRVAELGAFVQLDKVSKSDEFKSALGNAVAAPVKAAGELIERPGETTSNVVSGIGTMLGRAGRFVGGAVTSVGDKVSGPEAEKRQISKPVPLEKGTAPPRSVISDPLGYNSQRREWAKRLNVDPYTSNGPLSDKLGDFASVTFAGTFAVETTIGIVAAPLQYTVAANEQGKLEAYQYPPSDVEKRNEDRLKKMGIEGRPVRDFFRNDYFTPTLQTTLVLALESLGDAAGRGDLVTYATNAASEVEARFVNNCVLLLAQYGRTSALIVKVRSINNVIAGETRDGRLVIPVAVDYVAWTQVVNDFAGRPDLKGASRQLLIAGTATERAKRELAARGWTVSDKLAGAK